MKNRIFSLVSLAVNCIICTTGLAQNVGPATIGLAAFTPSDATSLANIIADESKDTELAFLPFEFQNDNRGPFDRAREVVHGSLPRLGANDTYRVTVYLHWADNHRLDWQDFRDNRSNATKTMMTRRATQTAQFIRGLREWNTNRIAAGGPRGGELKFTIVPMLEDNCTNASDYARCLSLIRSTLTDAGVNASTVNYRRSVAVGIRGSGAGARVESGSLDRLFRVNGASLEVHGDADAVTAVDQSGRVRLERGDCFTNDGTAMTVDDFNALRSRLARRGISALYWSAAYNGNRAQNRRERVLRPFTGSGGRQEIANLRAAM
jgi:hypothetical protein